MKKFRLLFIDDDAKSFTLIQNMLSGFDQPRYQIEWTATYAEGLTKLKDNQHDVCLLDYRLGHQNGVNLLQEALQAGCDIPIILLTAYGNFDVDLEVMELGSMDYLDKRQLTPDLLERSIRYAHTRKNLERELRQLYQEKKGLEQLKTDMIRIASHDIQNPVTSILLNLYMLRKQAKLELSASSLEHLDSIERKTNQIKNIVESILSLEKIEAIHQRGLSLIDLVPILAQVINEVDEKFTEKKQTFNAEVRADRIRVQGETTQMAEVITNILLNANRYTSEHGHIDVRLEIVDNEAVLTCKDDGYGVPKEDHERIFQPFFRSPGTANREEGTGLGLHLVKNIIDRHKGTILFESSSDRGSTFGFRLPLVDSSHRSDSTT